MDTILDITKVFLSFVCLCLLLPDVEWDNIFPFFHVRQLHWHIFGEMAPVTAIMGEISFMIQ